MIIKTLRPEEFKELKTFPDGFIPDPFMSVAIVASEDDELIGRLFILCPAHIEGPWIKPEKRNGLVGKKLIEAAQEIAKAAGITRLFAYAVSEQIADYLSRLGFACTDMTVWIKEL